MDKKNPEDVDTRAEDHLYDALRYGIMSRPRFSIFDYDPMGRPSSSMPMADLHLDIKDITWQKKNEVINLDDDSIALEDVEESVV